MISSESSDRITALFDSGNSRLHFGWWDGESVVRPRDIEYPEDKAALSDIVTEFLSETIPAGAAACSVSDKWRKTLFSVIDDILPGKLAIARTALDLPVDVSYSNPETIGVDRVLAAAAAFRSVQGSCVVVDAGTAVTVDAVGEDGVLLGGYIFPGLDALSWCLSGKTDLPKVQPAASCAGIGHSTVTCISHAVSTGFVGAIAELIRNARHETEGTAAVVLTGGGSELLGMCLPFETLQKPYLVLEGLGLSIDVLPLYNNSDVL